MGRLLSVAGLGVVLGFTALVGGPFGLLLCVIVASAVFVTSPGRRRVQQAGLLLAAAGLTAGILLGRVVVSSVNDPAVSVAPGTFETLIAAVVLGVLGSVGAVAGLVRRRTHETG